MRQALKGFAVPVPEWFVVLQMSKEWRVPPWKIEEEMTEYWWDRYQELAKL